MKTQFILQPEEANLVINLLAEHAVTKQGRGLLNRMMEYRRDFKDMAKRYEGIVRAAEYLTRGTDDIEIDDKAMISFPDLDEYEGVWVNAWVWAPKEDKSCI